ncbi:MAG: polyphosphate kinase 1 [Candidatus Latescibacteria bacterium]|nr:polyphosphate kinase 1 [Candidatus Latescibacterota bacterium]
MESVPKIEQSAEPVEVDLNAPGNFINRELSLLEFQRRVLEEAQDPGNPLLERVKFLSIVGSNLDEFYMVRVAGLRQQMDAGVVDIPADGLTPSEQVHAIRELASEIMHDMRSCWHQDLLPQLRSSGIHVVEYGDLTKRQADGLHKYFQEFVFPVLTPIAFDPGRPFPHISNLSLNLAVLIRDSAGKERFARIKVPGTLPRLVPVKTSGGNRRQHHFVWLGQLIIAHLEMLFPGMEIVEAHPFRVTRNADMVIQELEADDLLATMEEGVRQRRFGTVVRMAVNRDMSQRVREILTTNLRLNSEDIYTLEDPLGFSDLSALYRIDRYELKFPAFLPATHKANNNQAGEVDLFAAIRQQDILLHHPYDSFSPVVEFLNAAARDPNVLAIKQTLYRVGSNSPIVEALLKARENDKQVSVLVELKARFDEESNIEWARKLETAGVHVIYGLLGLKTHSKIALVVRQEGKRIRRYVHMATGNYNTVTAHLYTDLGYFTCNEDVGADATDFLNYLTGYSDKKSYRKVLVAPVSLRSGIEDLINREINHQTKGEPGHLIFKMNSLVDKQMIQLLYKASQSGVKIDLIVRGICCLRPGVPGLSENIRVISVVGRFLEHSRFYYFLNGGTEEIYLGSADLMPRNIDRRVELLFPVEEPKHIRYLRDEVMNAYLTDNVKSRSLCPDGTYERMSVGVTSDPIDTQTWLQERHRELAD